MSEHLSFDVLRDGIMRDPAFEGACKRYLRSGAPEPIAMAVLTAAGFPDLYVDALRYRFLRAEGVLTSQQDVLTGDDLDQAVDAAMVWSGKEGVK